MTLQEIAQEMLKDINRYAKEKEVEIPQLVQARTHKKARINKKWKKRFGDKVIFETKKAKVLDVTVERIVEFCSEKGLPLPDEMLTQQND